ncbi:BHLH domain-containing protein [Heracleum sosnowskyi]|uniref:BHLH domain-containing protein n=1 Tax=Heracleum sosnowskyi TaxID=360622 RepID=A0AAD8J5A2_9APIA|nr:BHLH domain-containing protein [Heracleum sosnowskyi]
MSQAMLQSPKLKGSMSGFLEHHGENENQVTSMGRKQRRTYKYRFLKLSSILEPGRPPKTNKAAILNDVVRMLTQLRSEANTLKESNEEVQEKIGDLKAGKHKLRDEKQKIKADKEKLEQQV